MARRFEPLLLAALVALSLAACKQRPRPPTAAPDSAARVQLARGPEAGVCRHCRGPDSMPPVRPGVVA